jgi:hypothetical protein
MSLTIRRFGKELHVVDGHNLIKKCDSVTEAQKFLGEKKDWYSLSKNGLEEYRFEKSELNLDDIYEMEELKKVA